MLTKEIYRLSFFAISEELDALSSCWLSLDAHFWKDCGIVNAPHQLTAKTLYL